MVRVFVQNEAGSCLKNYHDERTLQHLRTASVSHAYPYPYGFIIGTTAADSGCVDCFILTNRALKTGDVVECESVGLMEQFEDGLPDHNILARLLDETPSIGHQVETALTEHVLACFRHVAGTRVTVGRFLGVADAEAHIAAHRKEGTDRPSGVTRTRR